MAVVTFLFAQIKTLNDYMQMISILLDMLLSEWFGVLPINAAAKL